MGHFGRGSMTARHRRSVLAAAAAVGTAVLCVVPTDIVDTPLFVRAVPVRWWELPVALATAALVGLWVALGRQQVEVRESRTVTFGVLLSVLAVGCPTCNKIVLLILGTAGALGVFAPWQPVLAAVSLALLAVAVVVRLADRRRGSCPVPPVAADPEHPVPVVKGSS